MNRTYRSIWNDSTGTFVAVSELAKSRGRTSSTGASGIALPERPPFTLAALSRHGMQALSILLIMASGSNVYALPTGAAVAAGSATISGSAASMTVNQTTQNAVINWQSFSIGQSEAVRFVQPGSSSVALNRVLGADPSSILGSLSANGKVFLVNPNGILFGKGAQVNVGGLIASTMNITNGDFMAGNYKFSGAGNGAVVNQGTINADGGYVALLGANVSNEGVISARLGTVTLAAGSAATLDVAGDGLLNVLVNEGAINALAQNGGLIRADGGQVLLTALAAGNLLQSAVNNTGVIQAQTIENRNGTIRLMGDMQIGTANIAGTLDASAPNGGNGGFIETSAAHVIIADDAKITTAAPMGTIGTWLIDPQDFTIGSGPGNNITGAALSALLVTNSVVITTNTGPDAAVAGVPPVSTRNTATIGLGDINVNEAVTWTAAPTTTTLSLLAERDVNVNRAITATNGNVIICCGRDVNVRAAITTTNGSILVGAGRNASIVRTAVAVAGNDSTLTAITATDGNLMICAGNDVIVDGAAITLTRGSVIPAQSLGLPVGLTLSADTDGTGPGVGGGTVIFAPLTPLVTVAGPNAPVTINYNPVAYATPSNFAGNFTLSLGATLTQHMLVFPGADKTFDGSTTATLAGFKSTVITGAPIGVTLVAGVGNVAVFDTPAVGVNKTVTFSGFTLGGPNAADFALPISCCAPAVQRTTASISAVVVPPVVVPPVVIVPPVVVIPPVVPPVVVVPPVPAVVAAELALAETVVIQNSIVVVPPLQVPELNLTVVDAGLRIPAVKSVAVIAPPLPPEVVAPIPVAAVIAPPRAPVVYVPPQRPSKPFRN